MVFTAVLFDLGVDFLYVDGHCHYWVQEPGSTNDPFSAWRAYREGTLSPVQESALHDAVSYDDFARGAARCPDRSGTFDGSTTVVWDGASVSTCYGGFSGVDPDWPMRMALYQAATPMKAGVRIMVGRQDAAKDFPVYHWPLAQPPSAYETEYTRGLKLGQSVLITSAADAAALRALREQALADVATTPFAGEILLDPRGWALSLRDDLPFTRPADGLWEPPPGN